MFNAKHFALSFAALAACTTEPAVELAPQQSADALAAAVGIGILTPLDATSTWTVSAQPMGIADDNIEEEDKGQPKGDASDSVTDRPEDPAPETEEPGSGVEIPGESAGEAELGAPTGEREEPAFKIDGSYQIIVQEVVEGQYGIAAGDGAMMTISGEGAPVADGFVPLSRGGDRESENQFGGMGTVAMMDDASGCEIEWTREIDAKIEDDGLGIALISDTVIYLDPSCGEVAPSGGDYFNAYVVEMAREAQ